jgi:hypothetical protein
MKRPLLLTGFFAALLGACGCGSSKPEVPSWFKSGNSAKNGKSTTKPTSDTALNELSAKVKQLNRKITALNTAIDGVQKSKKARIAQLKQKGVSSSEDLKKPTIQNDRSVKSLLENLERDHAEETKYKALREEFEGLKLDGELTLERLDRQVKLAKEGISDKDLEDLEIAVRKIDARLKDDSPTNPVSDLKADAILDKELKEK